MTATITELGPNMSLEDKRKEAKTRLEEASSIEEKHSGPGAEPLTGAELERVKQLLLEVDALHEQIEADEERRTLVEKTQQLLDHYSRPVYPMQPGQGAKGPRTPGDQFVRSAQYLDLKNRGILANTLNRVDFSVAMADGTSLLEWKATLVGSSGTSGGALVANDVQARVVDILPRALTVMDLIPRLTTTSDTIEYVQQTTQTLTAAMTAEATGSALTGTDGRKPESTLAFATVTAPVRTCATWLPITNRLLSDAPAVRGIINSQLLYGVALTVEQQVISGDGTGENLTGILNTANIQTLGRGTNNEVDALFLARTMVRTGAHLPPTAIVMNPVDYQQVRLLRQNAASATLGSYLMGDPTGLGTATVWGLPVVESENVPVDTVIVANWDQGSGVFDREQAAVRVGLVNDQFIRNQQTILAEQRLAFVVWRPQAFCRVTGY